MNALTLVIAALCMLAIAYRYYCKFLVTRVLVLDPDRPTPAQIHNDGHDYFPTNRYVLFGHHFAAIAGAGPLIGPVLAAQFGFLPGTLWLLIGAVLGGAVHDLVILFASVRHNGESLAKIARRYISPTAGIVTGIAILFIIITALAGLAIVVVNALAESAWGTFTIVATIPAALFVGLWMYKLRKGRIAEASAIGVGLTLLAVAFGDAVAKSSIGPWFTYSATAISLALPVYGFIASVLPVWLLLCPRDYISSYMKIGTIALLAVGLIVVNPTIKMPALQFLKGGPIIPGPVWPFCFITIACGAVSGFHALIASGTTPKMISSEREIPMIGYGAMIVESFVGLTALIAACSLLPGDYFGINVKPDDFAKLGMAAPNLGEMARQVGETSLAGRVGGGVTLAVGMANIFANLPGMKHLMAYWYHFVIMFEALFILTTVDTGTRVGRYVVDEMIARSWNRLRGREATEGGLSRKLPLGQTALTSLLVCFAWGYLVYRNDIKTIWPMFGVANQLLAVMALAIGTSFILATNKPKYALVTFLPFCFMLVTTVTAGIWNIFRLYLPQRTFDGNLNALLCAVMIALVLTTAADAGRRWARAVFPRPAEAPAGAK
ncbi:MAG: carbon starvation protein A [Armatimonadetes bacterium]|nr:carbon starvation protein A [Armatimonadota bacterium]